MKHLSLASVLILAAGCTAPTVINMVETPQAADAGAPPVQPDAAPAPPTPDAGEPDSADAAQASPVPDAGEPDAGGDAAPTPPDADVADTTPPHDATPGVDSSPDHVGAVWCSAGGTLYIGCDGNAHTYTIVTPTDVCLEGSHATAVCSPGAQCEVTPAGGSITSGTCM